MKIKDNMYLGTLCRRGHDYENTGKSLRYKIGGDCILCRRCYNRQDGVKKMVQRERANTKLRIEMSLYCPKYLQCVNDSIKTGNKINCVDCPDSQKYLKEKIPYWLKEQGIHGQRRGFDELTEYEIWI